MTDRTAVRAQYAREGNLETRRSVWHPTADGRDPASVAAEAVRTWVRQARPAGADVLEVGCGTGAFAERLLAENPGARVVATDQSERFVELTRKRGVEARVADVQALPFPDASYDVVAALWMLYHVADLDLGLSEIRRVLRPGGRFVAVTNGDRHTADLRIEAGGEPLVTSFSSENGAETLGRHFAEVQREDLATRAVFPDHPTAEAYLRSFGDGVDYALPVFEGAREYAGHVTVFTCR